jgi:hypothetical protein
MLVRRNKMNSRIVIRVYFGNISEEINYPLKGIPIDWKHIIDEVAIMLHVARKASKDFWVYLEYLDKNVLIERRITRYELDGFKNAESLIEVHLKDMIDEWNSFPKRKKEK